MALALGAARRPHHLGADRRSRSAQIVDCVKALENDTFTSEELSEIDLYAREADVNLWARSAEL